jgi:methionine-rich copper-binding protein CopC
VKRFLAIAVAAVMSISFGVTAASAHAQLVYSSPGVGQETRTAPTQVVLEFDGELIDLHVDDRNVIQVTDSAGNRYDTGPSILDGAQLTVQLNPITEPGTYTVDYLVISEDGHPVERNYQWILLPPIDNNGGTTTSHKPSNGKTGSGVTTKPTAKPTAKPTEKPTTEPSKEVDSATQGNAFNVVWAALVALFSLLIGAFLVLRRRNQN